MVVILRLWACNATATLWVLVLPFAVSSLALSFGNWYGNSVQEEGVYLSMRALCRSCHPHPRSQHIFIDPSAPRSDYHLTYNCVGCQDNQRTFNDGYHVVHHVNSKIHWADMPAQFEATLERLAANDGTPRG